jgi:hypothetical protein
MLNLMNRSDTTFSTGMIAALITYLIHAYPQALYLCRVLSPMADSVLRGRPFPGLELESNVVEILDTYKQSEERATVCFDTGIQRIDLPTDFIPLSFTKM